MSPVAFVFPHPPVYTKRDRFGNPQNPVHSLAWSLLERHDDSRLIEKQTPYEIVTHGPKS
jgi:hypothetical protein